MQNPVIQWGKKFINTFDLSHTQSILDMGCRQGELSAYLSHRYPKHRITAIDNQESNIEKAKALPLTPVDFERADASHLEWTNAFDAVVSFSYLHWIDNKQQVLKNIYQALKPGGKAYLQFFALHGRLKNDRFIYQVARSSEWNNYYSPPDYSEITAGAFVALASQAGFIMNKLEFIQYNTPFDNGEALQCWLGTWATQAKNIPLRKRDSFLMDVVQTYLNHHQLSADLNFPYHEYVLEVILEKPTAPIENPSFMMLTKREQEVVKAYLQGKTAKEVAEFFALSPKTIEFHLANIKRKLHCYRRSDLHHLLSQVI